MSPGADLAVRFLEHVRSRDVLETGDTVLVALSGGVDSMVLLHLLRFGADEASVKVVAAHLDHAMRPDSADDATWLRGVADGWGVPLLSTRLDPPPADEAEARRRRYAFLEAARRDAGARLVVTAHHADDQAETVLFRVLRGTGVAGLQGVRERRWPGIWRPLLPFTRAEILAYADEVALEWREDPTNRDPYARNVLRHRIIPAAEEGVAPGARRALVGLARRAREDEQAWRSVMPRLLGEADLRPEDEGFSLSAEALRAHHPALRARLIRAVAHRLDQTLSEAGTRLAVEFTSSGESGAGVPLGNGLELRRELDRVAIVRRRPSEPDVPVIIDGGEEGEAEARLGGSTYRVRWSRHAPTGEGWTERFSMAEIRFPVVVRARIPGDRVRLSYGTKKLKKLMLEARVPPGQRHRIPVLADDAGEVLWVPEVVRSIHATEGSGEDVIHIGITHADSD